MPKEEFIEEEVKASKVALEDEVMIITTITAHSLFRYRNGSDAIALYLFYYYTVKWQKTDQAYATPKFCMKGLHWGKERFNNAQRVLKELELAEIIQKRDAKGKIIGCYMRLNYVWKQEKAEKVESILRTKEIPQKKGLKKANLPTSPQNRRVGLSAAGFQTTNAILTNKQNASLTITKESKLKKNSICKAEQNKPFFFSTEKETDEIKPFYCKSWDSFNEIIDNVFYKKRLSLISAVWERSQLSKTDRSALIRMLQNPEIGTRGVHASVSLQAHIREDRLRKVYSHPQAPRFSTYFQLEKNYDNLWEYKRSLEGHHGYECAIENENEKRGAGCIDDDGNDVAYEPYCGVLWEWKKEDAELDALTNKKTPA